MTITAIASFRAYIIWHGIVFKKINIGNATPVYIYYVYAHSGVFDLATGI